MKLLLRKANPSDFSQLITIWKLVGFYYPFWDTKKNLLKKIKLQPGLFITAEVDGKIAGGVIGTYDGWAAYINHLAVHPNYQELKIEDKLLSKIENCFKNLGVKKVFVQTLPGHIENRLYKKYGYAKWGVSIGWEKSI